jgi:hypothetical protein
MSRCQIWRQRSEPPMTIAGQPAWARTDVLKSGKRLVASTVQVELPAVSPAFSFQRIDDNRLPAQRVVACKCAKGRNG